MAYKNTIIVMTNGTFVFMNLRCNDASRVAPVSVQFNTQTMNVEEHGDFPVTFFISTILFAQRPRNNFHFFFPITSHQTGFPITVTFIFIQIIPSFHLSTIVSNFSKIRISNSRIRRVESLRNFDIWPPPLTDAAES